MGRKAQYDRQEVLEKATELFRIKGYEVSMRTVFKITELNPNSLYAQFGNKDGLYIEALHNYRNNIEQNAMYILYEVPRSLDSIRLFFDLYIQQADEFGCLMMNTLTHHKSMPEEAVEIVDQYYFDLAGSFVECLKEDTNYERVPTARLKVFATYLVGALQGVIVALCQGMPEEIVKRQVEIALTARP